MKGTSKPDTRRKYDATFRAETLRRAAQSRSTQTALGRSTSTPNASTSGRRRFKRRLQPLWGVALDPATVLALPQLRAANRRQAQELDLLNKAIASACFTRRHSQKPDQ